MSCSYIYFTLISQKISWAFIFILVGTTWNEYRSFDVSRICERHNHDPNIINHSIINTHRLICACFSLDIRPTILTNCDNFLCTRSTGGCARFPDRFAVTSHSRPVIRVCTFLSSIDTQKLILLVKGGSKWVISSQVMETTQSVKLRHFKGRLSHL